MSEEENTIKDEEKTESVEPEVKKTKKKKGQQESEEEKVTRLYELSFLLLPMIAEESLPDEVQKIRKVIEDNNGQVFSEQAPSMINLAYKMETKIENKKKAFETAYFGYLKFQIASSDLEKVQKAIKENSNILRFLVVKPQKEVEPKSKSDKKNADGKKEEKAKLPDDVNEEEIDKTIEDLVV